jgi:hypothetical protein
MKSHLLNPTVGLIFTLCKTKLQSEVAEHGAVNGNYYRAFSA